MNDIDECIHCNEPIAWNLAIETASGDYVHAHCEKDYEQDQAERAYENFAGDFSGAEYDSHDRR